VTEDAAAPPPPPRPATTTTAPAARAPGPAWAEPWIELAPLIVLAVTTVVLSWVYAPLFRGELAGDDNTFHFAEVARIGRAIHAGDLDWWNPSANGGFATGYYYQLVPAAVPGLFAALFGHPLLWFQLGAFIPLGGSGRVARGIFPRVGARTAQHGHARQGDNTQQDSHARSSRSHEGIRQRHSSTYGAARRLVPGAAGSAGRDRRPLRQWQDDAARTARRT